MAIRFIDLENPKRNDNGNIDEEQVQGGSDWWRGHEDQGAVWTGSVRRVQNKCWSETGECLQPIVVYRCCGTDKQKDLYKSLTPKTIVRRWPGSGRGWGSKSPITVD